LLFFGEILVPKLYTIEGKKSDDKIILTVIYAQKQNLGQNFGFGKNISTLVEIYAHRGSIYLIKNSDIVKYYYNLK